MNPRETTLWTALITPLQEDGTLDTNTFLHLLKRQEEANNGVVILGSTGEGINLSPRERATLVKIVSRTRLRVPVVVGVDGLHLDRALAWIAFCETQNVDGYLLVTPLYAKPGPQGQQAWFRALLNASSRPCMIYNIPSRTGTDLSVEALEALANHPNLWAVKEASEDRELSRWIQANCPTVDLFSGNDELFSDQVSWGMKGLVSVMANVWPQETHCFTEKVLGAEGATDLELWRRAGESMFLACNPVPAKALLHQRGYLRSDGLKAPLTQLDLPDRSALIEVDREVRRWYQGGRA